MVRHTQPGGVSGEDVLNRLNVYDMVLMKKRLLELCNMGGVISCFEPKFLWPQCPRAATRSMRDGFHNRGLKLESDKTAHILRNTDPLDLSEYFIWTFVRNPFDRVVSLKHMPENIDIPWDKWMPGLSGRVTESFSQDNPDNFDHRAVKRRVDARHHSVCSYSTHINGKQFVDFIGRYENLEDDWQRLLGLLGIEYREPLITMGKSNRSNTDTYYGNPSDVKAVESAYADDLSILY